MASSVQKPHRPAKSAKAVLLEDYAAIAQALASPARLMLLEQLAQAERSVDGLARKTGVSVANCSQHLQHLKAAGLVSSRREGRRIVYALADEMALEVMGVIARLAERNNARVALLLREIAGGENIEPLTRLDLAKRLESGEVTVLDVRPRDEFEAGHLPGAIHVLPEEIAGLTDLASPNHEIVAYCRGPYCLYARQAEAVLRQKGLAARRMEGGLPEWRSDGLPIVYERADG